MAALDAARDDERPLRMLWNLRSAACHALLPSCNHEYKLLLGPRLNNVPERSVGAPNLAL